MPPMDLFRMRNMETFSKSQNTPSRIDQNSMYLLEGLKSKSKSSQGTTSGPLAHGLLQSPWSTTWTLLQDQTCGRFWISPGVTVGCGWDPDPASPAGWAPATKIAGNSSINIVWKPTITRQSSSRRQIDVWIFTVFEEPARDSQNVTLLWTPPFLDTWDTLGMGSTTTHPGTRRRLLRPPSCWRRGWHVWPGKTLKLRGQFWGSNHLTNCGTGIPLKTVGFLDLLHFLIIMISWMICELQWISRTIVHPQIVFTGSKSHGWALSHRILTDAHGDQLGLEHHDGIKQFGDIRGISLWYYRGCWYIVDMLNLKSLRKFRRILYFNCKEGDTICW